MVLLGLGSSLWSARLPGAPGPGTILGRGAQHVYEEVVSVKPRTVRYCLLMMVALMVAIIGAGLVHAAVQAGWEKAFPNFPGGARVTAESIQALWGVLFFVMGALAFGCLGDEWRNPPPRNSRPGRPFLRLVKT